MKVGEIYKTDNWGDVEILEYTDWKHIKVKFLKSGNIATKRSREIKCGNIRDQEALQSGIQPFSSHSKGKGALTVGDFYDSNFYGKAKVLEYHSSINVVIEFVNTGNKYKVQKHALVKGLVKDSVLERQINGDIARDRALEKSKASKVKQEQDEIKRNARTSARLAEIAAKDRERYRKHEEIMSVVYSSLDGEYSISKILSRDNFEVTFKNTGCVVRATRYSVTEGKVKDVSLIPIYTDEELSHIRSEKSASYYQKNRLDILQKAKDWQKNNPEKCRLRNRHRRAKRLSAEGTHTQAEVELIFQEQGGKCSGCSQPLDDTKHLDHFVPLDLGGSNSQENLQWLCQFCNNSKSAKEPSLWLYTIGTSEYQERRAAALAYCD